MLYAQFAIDLQHEGLQPVHNSMIAQFSTVSISVSILVEVTDVQSR